jgi:hypothetical protein
VATLPSLSGATVLFGFHPTMFLNRDESDIVDLNMFRKSGTRTHVVSAPRAL